MKIVHHHITANEIERLQRQTAIHRKCLMLIRGRPGQTPVRTPPRVG